MGAAKVTEAYARFASLTGGPPEPQEDLTLDQLSSLFALVSGTSAPYVDFAVWGPYGHRIAKKVRMTGMVIGHKGELKNIEIYEPACVADCEHFWFLFRTGCLMLGAVSLSTLDRYRDIIKSYANRYGPKVWVIVYQADVRCRSEHMERIRRRGEAESAVAKAAGHTHALEAARPWDWVWSEAIKDLEFWRIELEEPALLMLTRGQRSSPATPGPAAGSVKRFSASEIAPQAKSARYHNVDGNVFKTNRKGTRLCEDYNRGSCPSAPNSMACPKHSGFSHQCSRCLEMSHTLVTCPRSDFPAAKPGGKGGKSKGKGKGGGKKPRWQY